MRCWQTVQKSHRKEEGTGHTRLRSDWGPLGSSKGRGREETVQLSGFPPCQGCQRIWALACGGRRLRRARNRGVRATGGLSGREPAGRPPTHEVPTPWRAFSSALQCAITMKMMQRSFACALEAAARLLATREPFAGSLARQLSTLCQQAARGSPVAWQIAACGPGEACALQRAAWRPSVASPHLVLLRRLSTASEGDCSGSIEILGRGWASAAAAAAAAAAACRRNISLPVPPPHAQRLQPQTPRCTIR